jgi:hypothetical protein
MQCIMILKVVIIFLTNTYQLILVMETSCVYFAVRNSYLNIIQTSFGLQQRRCKRNTTSVNQMLKGSNIIMLSNCVKLDPCYHVVLHP